MAVEDKASNGDVLDTPVVDTSPPPKIRKLMYEDVIKCISYIVRGVELQQPRLISRAINSNTALRKYINAPLFKKILEKYVPSTHSTYEILEAVIDRIEVVMDAAKNEMDIDNGNGTINNDSMNVSNISDVESIASGLSGNMTPPPITLLPEVEIFLLNLGVTSLLREKLNDEALGLSDYTLNRLNTLNRRTLDGLGAKSYFYYSLVNEMIAETNGNNNNYSQIRQVLLKAYRTSCIRRDESGQAMLLNLTLRNYLSDNLIELAASYSSKATFPETASNNQLCRYLYYMGRIRAVQLEYGEAHQRLLQASRKAPSDGALGFTVEVTKLSILVQLLMGEVPMAAFNRPEMKVPLQPYFELTKAVKNGDLATFRKILDLHKTTFQNDKNLSFVQRLQHNVLKTGLKKISISYSRVSLEDVANKLLINNGNAKSAEYICSKAIRDGVIDATIDHESGWLCSNESADVYCSEEPQKAFHRRIAFCLDTHNEAVKSMRYPPDAYKKEIKKGGGDEEKTIEELLETIDDEMDFE